MAFTLWTPAFTDFISLVPAAFLNKIRTELAQAIDGAGGGDYTPTSKIRILGTEGVEWAGTSNGAWPRVSSRTVTQHVPLVIVGTSQADIPSTATDAHQRIALSDIANVQAVRTTEASAAGNYTWLSLGRPPDGSTMTQVVVKTKGTAGGASNPADKATYKIIRWAAATAFQDMSALTNDAHTYGGGGNWQTTVVDTTITVNANAVIDYSVYQYALLVNHPADGGTGSGIYVYSVTPSYTVTQLRSP